MDDNYYSLLMGAVTNLPSAGEPAMRQAIYDRACKALLTQLRTLSPPLPEVYVLLEQRKLEGAIAQIEAGFESNAGISVPTQSPYVAGAAGPPQAGSTDSVAPTTTLKPASADPTHEKLFEPTTFALARLEE